jgi:esterase/lipase superfamily enzyme
MRFQLHGPMLRSVCGAMLLGVMLAGCLGLPSMTGALGAREDQSTQGIRSVDLIFASTRPGDVGEGDGQAQPRARFSRRSITVPPGHQPGVIERPSVLAESRKRHFTLADRTPLTGSVSALVAEMLAARGESGRDVLVYVHGFNTDPREASFRLAQIVTDTGFAGVPVLFTWPSRSSIFGYGADRERATSSRDALERLLVDLSAVQGSGRVHIVAHSMGTWLAMEALRQAAIAGQGNLNGKIGEVMLAHPDLDIDVFRAQLARIGRADNISLFVASDDRALALSRRLAGQVRLGAADLTDKATREEVTALGVRVYDLTERGSDTFRHATFADAPQVVRVIGARLKDAPVRDAGATAADMVPAL